MVIFKRILLAKSYIYKFLQDSELKCYTLKLDYIEGKKINNDLGLGI